MSYRSENITMWFDRRIVLRKSPINGIGTFATEPIKAGETLLWVTGGQILTPQDWETGIPPVEPEMYNEEPLPDNTTIVTPKAFHYYINHSCEPNSVDMSKHPTWTHYITLRDIQAGEEITAKCYTYGEGKLEMCNCQSPKCRWVHHE